MRKSDVFCCPGESGLVPSDLLVLCQCHCGAEVAVDSRYVEYHGASRSAILIR